MKKILTVLGVSAAVTFGVLLHFMEPGFAAQQTINAGSAPGDNTGETLNSAFGKVNSNFTELYSSIPTLPLSVANGGTNSATAAAARTALGVAIGTNVEAWDADLDTLAGKTIPSGGTLADTSSGQTFTNKTLTSPVVNTPTGIVKGDVGLGNVDNTSDATKNAASVTLTNKTISGASNTLSNVATTSLTGTLQAAQEPAHTGDVTNSAGSVAMTIPTGTVTDDKASLSVKPAVTVVATTNQTKSGTPTIDSQATADGSLILATAQSTGAENGPWVAHAGAWTRPAWYPAGGTTQAIQFSTTLVRLGTTYQGSTWRMTTAAPITIDTTATTWAIAPIALNTNTVTGTLPAANGGNIIVDVQTFTGSGTWTAPTGTIKAIVVEAVGPGGPGGGGARTASGTASSGGGGGGSGAVCVWTFTAAQITSPVTVTIGTLATVGAGATVAGNAGAAGGVSTASTFGTYMGAGGGGGGAGGQVSGNSGGGSGGSCRGRGSNGVAGVTSTAGTANFGSAAGGSGVAGGNSGNNAGNGAGGGGGANGAVGKAGGFSFLVGASAGGSGGGISTAPAGFDGGGSPNPMGGSATDTPGGNSGGANVGSTGSGSGDPGGGAGGGGGNSAGNAGDGGAGGSYGGGGGGGGSAVAGNAGNGGAGGPGIIRVTTYF